MPRSAEHRGLGFRSEGLIRILTAADPAEVLTAMEALGITFRDPEPGLLDLFAIAIGLVLGPIGEILSLLDDIDVALLVLFSNLGANDQLGDVGAKALTLRERTKKLRTEFASETQGFRERIEEEKANLAKGRPTSVI